jgi:hypothetical protein
MNFLVPLGRIILEKLIIDKLVKISQSFIGTEVYTRVCNWAIS